MRETSSEERNLEMKIGEDIVKIDRCLERDI